MSEHYGPPGLSICPAIIAFFLKQKQLRIIKVVGKIYKILPTGRSIQSKEISKLKIFSKIKINKLISKLTDKGGSPSLFREVRTLLSL